MKEGFAEQVNGQFKLTNHCGTHHCSLYNVIADISVLHCLFMN